jgi:hypothetical protein
MADPDPRGTDSPLNTHKERIRAAFTPQAATFEDARLNVAFISIACQPAHVVNADPHKLVWLAAMPGGNHRTADDVRLRCLLLSGRSIRARRG